MKNFEELPGHSRVWIYQSSRLLSNEEAATVDQDGLAFVENWTSHGKQMQAAIKALHNCFIVVALDEQSASASGCGIDKSVAFMKELETKLSINLFERTNVAYRDAEGIKLCSINDFEKLFIAGVVTDQTLVFNNLVSTKKELEKSWEVPVANSWHSRMFKTVHS